jgi:hypothetical protein
MRSSQQRAKSEVNAAPKRTEAGTDLVRPCPGISRIDCSLRGTGVADGLLLGGPPPEPPLPSGGAGPFPCCMRCLKTEVAPQLDVATSGAQLPADGLRRQWQELARAAMPQH